MLVYNLFMQKLSNFVIFQTEEGKVNIDVFFADETLWLTQKVMAELFDTTKQKYLDQDYQMVFI